MYIHSLSPPLTIAVGGGPPTYQLKNQLTMIEKLFFLYKGTLYTENQWKDLLEEGLESLD